MLASVARRLLLSGQLCSAAISFGAVGSSSGGGATAAAAAAAATAAAAAGAVQPLRLFSAAAEPQQQQQQQQQQPAPVQLTPEQEQHVAALRALVAAPLRGARDAALLTALAAGYRDLAAIMGQLHARDILGVPRPLLDEPPPATGAFDSSAAGAAAAAAAAEALPEAAPASSQAFFPLRDFTRLPDEPPPLGGWLRNHLSERVMTRPYAFAALLPNHMEVSYQARAHVVLWPAMEAYYPALLDVHAALRHLKPHHKRTRTTRARAGRGARCRLGWRRKTPYHKQRVFWRVEERGGFAVPPAPPRA